MFAETFIFEIKFIRTVRIFTSYKRAHGWVSNYSVYRPIESAPFSNNEWNHCDDVRSIVCLNAEQKLFGWFNSTAQTRRPFPFGKHHVVGIARCHIDRPVLWQWRLCTLKKPLIEAAATRRQIDTHAHPPTQNLCGKGAWFQWMMDSVMSALATLYELGVKWDMRMMMMMMMMNCWGREAA
jgi:hypothetical protein